jgi:hypothetical protein
MSKESSQKQLELDFEVWKTVKPFPDYAISNFGSVKRLTDSNNNRKAGFILKTKANSRTGYIQVSLWLDGKYHAKMVHRLVLNAFAGDRPTKRHQTNHINGIKDDNRIKNLEWVTPSENVIHAHATGLSSSRRGEKNNLSVLKSDEVWLIKKLIYHGVLQRIIGNMFKVNRATISYIKSGKTWAEVIYNETI